MAEFVEHEYDWLIIFLVYNNNYYDLKTQDTDDYYTMEEQTKYILNQVRYTQYSKNVKTIFVEAEIKNNEKTEEVETSSYKNPIATLSILEKRRSSWLSALDKTWRRIGDIDIMTNSDSLQKVLTKIKNTFPAKKHMVVTAGHGSIVGINSYIPEFKQQPNRKKSDVLQQIFEKEIKHKRKDSFEKELTSEIITENGDLLLFLTSLEISEVFQEVFKKIDVLVMYNCVMQNIFTQYDFRETANWLVAPLSGISIPGFNYQTVISEISLNPKIESEAIAELFINSIRVGNGYSLFKDDIESTWKIAAIKMNKENYELIQQQFDILFIEINKLAQNSDNVINCLNDAVRHLFNYGNYCLPAIDILDIGILFEFFKDKISREFNDLSTLIPYINKLQDAIKRQQAKYIFEGYSFYDNGVRHKEDDPVFRKAVVNSALLFPFRKFNSDLLQLIYNKCSYQNNSTPIKYKVPSFLKNNNYANVINKLLNLPQ